MKIINSSRKPPEIFCLLDLEPLETSFVGFPAQVLLAFLVAAVPGFVLLASIRLPGLTHVLDDVTSLFGEV